MDQDCSGQSVEDYVAQATSCGVGACARSGATSCVNGQVQNSCQAGTPAANDATCDGIDNDCSGQIDEDYVSQATSCGVGGCRRTGSTSCVSGKVQDSCQPGAPAANDATCNGVDDDCSGQTDEDYVSRATVCGAGVCLARGQTSCSGGREVDSCTPGQPTAQTDTTCNGVDEDCSGQADEDFVSQSTDCSVGQCGAKGSTSCQSGQVVNSCKTPDDSCQQIATVCMDQTVCYGQTPCTGQYCNCEARACKETGTFCSKNGQVCSGQDQCGDCACRAPTCTNADKIVGSDDKYVYYGKDECGALCAPKPRCDHGQFTCQDKTTECGVDVLTQKACECGPETCRPYGKTTCQNGQAADSRTTCSGQWCNWHAPVCNTSNTTCYQGQTCSQDECGNACNCASSCGASYTCMNTSTSCPLDCSGNRCGNCTTCTNGCNSSTGRCNLIIARITTQITTQVVAQVSAASPTLQKAAPAAGTTSLFTDLFRRMLGITP